MSIKHSKYRNTAILFELLVRQTTADLLENKDSHAVKILRKYFNNTELGKEYYLYSQFTKSQKLSEVKADIFISTILEQRKKLNQQELSKIKYNLIKEIKSRYDIDNFFKAKIENYKIYASIYTLFESANSKSIDSKQILENKLTLLEYIAEDGAMSRPAPQNLVEEFMKEDKEIRLLAYKILVEKFNVKYKGLSDKQKEVLKEYINNISETENLKKFVNTKIVEIKKDLLELSKNISDKTTQIKLNETIKLIKPINKNGFVKDEHITNVLQFIELVETLKSEK
jgi:hypothetical protein